ncbi:MAG: exo-alpha-sialidase, partial [Planctomycetota bacterium]
MNRKLLNCVIFLPICASNVLADIPVTAEIVEVRKIWDGAAHNAFTDLIFWNDSFYCVFREGRGHVSSDGSIRVLKSKSADKWEPAALVKLDGYDLRDPHVSITPDGPGPRGRLMLVGGAAPRKEDNQSVPTGTFVSFSADGREWTQPQIVVP